MSESRRTFATRLLTAYALIFLLLIGGFALVLERSILWKAALVGLAGIGLAWLVAWRLLRHVREMTAAVEAIGAGNTTARLERSGVAEFDRLVVAVNSMATELDDRGRLSAEERQLLEQVLAVVKQGIVLVSDNDAIVYANPVARDLIKAPDDLATLTPHAFQRMVRKARATQSVIQEDIEHGQPVRLLRLVAAPFQNDQRVLLAFTDVTEQQRVEAVRRDFVAAASHELKTPVAAILASAQTMGLALEKDPVAAMRFAGQIERSAEQLARLVGDLLDLSRLESSTAEPELVMLDQVVGEEVSRIRPRAEEAGLTLSQDLVSAEIVGSAGDLRLAVRNLLDNAVRHTGSGGSVAVRMSRPEGQVVVEVADTGEGIPRRELPRIFERFYRVDSARSRATGGTGLGLAIVKHVAERHGGAVSAESELGVGSKFFLRLPVSS